MLPVPPPEDVKRSSLHETIRNIWKLSNLKIVQAMKCSCFTKRKRKSKQTLQNSQAEGHWKISHLGENSPPIHLLDFPHSDIGSGWKLPFMPPNTAPSLSKCAFSNDLQPKPPFPDTADSSADLCLLFKMTF